MKKLLLCALIMLFSTNLFAQNLTLDELISLRKKDLSGVEEYLTAKGWSYLKGKEETYENLGSATFTYKKSNYSDEAESFIKYMNGGAYDIKRISIQTLKKDIYLFYLNRIKGYGCKLIEEKIEDDDIIKFYQGATITFKITISTLFDEDNQSTVTTYHFLLIENSDYVINFFDK